MWGNPEAHQARFQDFISKLKFDMSFSKPLAQRATLVSDFESTDGDLIVQVISILLAVSSSVAGLECTSIAQTLFC
jgi:hypothetical protein